MMKRETFPIAKIYVPAKRRATLDVAKAREIAESILKDGQQTPIMVRRDGDRFVLVEGLHRLEACKQLGEETILGYLVQARLQPGRHSGTERSEGARNDGHRFHRNSFGRQFGF